MDLSMDQAPGPQLAQLQDQHPLADALHRSAQLTKSERPIGKPEQEQALPLAAHDVDCGVEPATVLPLLRRSPH